MCGIIGVFGHNEAAKIAFFGLYALQHRGQESAGIVTSDGKEAYEHRALGLVAEVFNEPILQKLKGHLAVGHVRYSTTGSTTTKNTQPFFVIHGKRTFALAHNGNLVNAHLLRTELEKQGSLFQTSMDSEIIVHLIAKSLKKGLVEAIRDTMEVIEGAYSVILLSQDKLVAFRDPHGFRPLALGMLNGGYILASETCAFDLVQAQYLRDIEPGEILVIDESGLNSYKGVESKETAHCIFEFIYFARPDSNIFGQNVYNFRKQLGFQLAEECPIKADFVMPFPDSGNYAAIGYAQATGLPFEMGVIRNHYVGRTFIQPSQSMRDFSVRVKLNPVKDILKGKKVAVVDDSLVRGTTSRTRVKAIREAGAFEINMLISCPPIKFPCFYGIDFPSRGELIAAKHSVEEIRRYLELDRLHYLSLEGLIKAAGGNHKRFCLACFNGKYPVPIKIPVHKEILEKD
ncbi:amidophosphoribosyltransferase [Thermodesulfatator autotrophicus]|uniref:Amidophosphoribosyltransferase n=1 Tax=Thermodesulfatator autotrophicus TaxID=1795632 RepID=A0A177E4N1_9BACT|nr:amidophosphoribosyltransferase [Thermodesulfatator autotrophicus]OAG26865.1 amidophosphoribosyltransferase [Thermodesulfatator autotrophicus]